MLNFSRGRLAVKYITFELLPVFLMGVTVFVIVLIMFQSFKLSEYVIVHGAKIEMITKLVFYMMLGYLPMLFPIALLFAVLMVYGRMSNDSEIVAFKALGLSPYHLLMPILAVGTVISILSLQTSFRLAPWGNRQLDELINLLSQTRPGVAVREGVFSEGFFDLVVYANKVDSRTGHIEKVFIYDERNINSPVTIIAKEGQLLNKNTLYGQEAFLRLHKGNLHKAAAESYTKIEFGTYDISLYDPHDVKARETAADAMNLRELQLAKDDPRLDEKQRTKFAQEWYRRWALSATCLVFAFVGFGLGTVTNRRTVRSGSLVISISVIVIFWALQVGFEALGRSGKIPMFLGAWMTNLIFFLFGVVQFRRLQEN